MKAVFILVLLSILILNNYAQQNGQWEIINQGVWGTFDFVSEEIGFIADSYRLLKTEDAGKNWFQIETEGNYVAQNIDFINENIGWSIRENKIFKTINGGYNWSLQYEAQEEITDLFALDDSTVYICGYGLGVYKTIDGGDNWISCNSDVLDGTWFDEIIFINNETGCAAGYNYDKEKPVICRTVDGGQSWQILNTAPYNHIFNLNHINDSTAYAIARDGSDKNFIVQTTDSCASWKVKTTNNFTISDIAFFESDIAYAVMNDSAGNDNLWKSHDNGSHWDKLAISDGNISDLYFFSPQLGFVTAWSSPSRKIYKTNDHGLSWDLQFFSCPFSDVAFINNTCGFACGGWCTFRHGRSCRGDIWFTRDGGFNWTNTDSVEGMITLCTFINDSVGFFNEINGWSEELKKTTDGGMSWRTIHPPPNYNWVISDLYFADRQNGWLTAYGGDSLAEGPSIFKTTDAGENWQMVWIEPDTGGAWNALNSIHVNDSLGFAVGDGGFIVKIINGESYTVLNTFTDLPLTKVFVVNEKHGWVASGYENDQDFKSRLFRTNNAGKTWNKTDFEKYIINDMCFSDSLTGWAVGADTSGLGIILGTQDGGINWYTAFEGIFPSINAIFIKDGVGWAVGDNGLVLSTRDFTSWVNQSTGETYPARYGLSQNYPNPFNSSTTIEYSVQTRLIASPPYVPIQVELTIFNLLGQKIETLLDKKQKTGSYKVQWDASGFASGVYYYRLKAGDFVKVRKMLLLK